MMCAADGSIGVGRRPIDLFHGPAWSTKAPARDVQITSPRPCLVASLLLVALLLCSMAFPWFTSAETPAWTPFSHWLNLGSGPGTQKWGILVLMVDVAMAAGLIIGLLWPRKGWLFVLLVLATVLVVVTVLEASASVSVNPGPNLHADYGAWIGSAASVLAWSGIAAAVYIAFRRPIEAAG